MWIELNSSLTNLFCSSSLGKRTRPPPYCHETRSHHVSRIEPRKRVLVAPRYVVLQWNFVDHIISNQIANHLLKQKVLLSTTISLSLSENISGSGATMKSLLLTFTTLTFGTRVDMPCTTKMPCSALMSRGRNGQWSRWTVQVRPRVGLPHDF